MTMTDDEIKAFRAELLADSWARDTDAPYACLRALKPARGRLQKAAREQARRRVAEAHRTWIVAGKDGIKATEATLGFGLR